MSASPPLRQPCPPGACVCERERRRPARTVILLLTRRGRAAHGRSHWKPCAARKTWNTCCGMEEQLGIRLRIAPAFGEVRSMRGIRMRFEEQPGLCRKTRQAIPPPSAAAWRSARKSPTPCSTPMTCCATPEGTERQEEDVAQDLGGLQEYRRITPMALFALQAAADAGEPRSTESLAGLATAPGFSSPTPPARRRTSPAGGASRHRTGCAVRRGGCRRGFPCRAAIGAAQGLLQLAGTAGRALAPTVEALPLMVCRVAALPGHRPRRAGVRAGRRGPACPERSAATPGRWLQAAAETPDDIAPRLDQFARVRCRCRRAPAPLLPR